MLLALRFYTSDSFQSTAGDKVGMIRVSRMAQVIDAFNLLATEHIRLPATLTAANASAIGELNLRD